MDIRNALVAQNYASNLAAAKPEPGGSARIIGAAQDFMSTLRASEQQAMSSMTGGGDPHSLVQALAQTELAVQSAVSVRDKVVEAYQEILRMPI